MTERPILFSGAMCLAILAGSKTMTRRVVTPQPAHAQVHMWRGRTIRDAEHRTWCWKQHDFGDGDPINATPGAEMAALCPYGVPGDRLWVREAFAVPPGSTSPGDVVYRAEVGHDLREEASIRRLTGRACVPWTPSIHMPRWASRITLEVTGVRVERLQDMSEDDARAEGARSILSSRARWPECAPTWSMENPHPAEADPVHGAGGCLDSPQMAFANKWNAINANRSGCSWWDNPWVWVVQFRRVQP